MMDTLLDMYNRAVRLHGENNAAARAFKTQLEAREATKGKSVERMFIAGGYGKQMQQVKKNKPA